jgi:hypothetical protein
MYTHTPEGVHPLDGWKKRRKESHDCAPASAEAELQSERCSCVAILSVKWVEKRFFFFLLGWIARGGGKVKVYHVPPSPSVILVATRHRLLLVVGCGNDPRCVGEAASQQHTHF